MLQGEKSPVSFEIMRVYFGEVFISVSFSVFAFVKWMW